MKQLTAASPGVPLADTTNPVRPVPLMRDPFAAPARARVAPPDAAPEPAADPYAVGGIFIDGTSRFAVIGGRRVAEGDSLLGYWVAEITPRSVLLWRSNEFKRLSWSES